MRGPEEDMGSSCQEPLYHVMLVGLNSVLCLTIYQGKVGIMKPSVPWSTLQTFFKVDIQFGPLDRSAPKILTRNITRIHNSHHPVAIRHRFRSFNLCFMIPSVEKVSRLEGCLCDMSQRAQQSDQERLRSAPISKGCYRNACFRWHSVELGYSSDLLGGMCKVSGVVIDLCHTLYLIFQKNEYDEVGWPLSLVMAKPKWQCSFGAVVSARIAHDRFMFPLI
eukprot:Gb_36318 [translate_table: standard]